MYYLIDGIASPDSTIVSDPRSALGWALIVRTLCVACVLSKPRFSLAGIPSSLTLAALKSVRNSYLCRAVSSHKKSL